jgi:DNA-binding LytR/AlgR family response regulator
MLAGRQILVVEDEWLIAQELRALLQEQRAAVIGPVATLGETLSLIEGTQKIDAAILDIKLQDGDVFPAAKRLDDRGVPILFHSGYTAATLTPRFANYPVLSKPAADLPETLVRLMLKSKRSAD